MVKGKKVNRVELSLLENIKALIHKSRVNVHRKVNQELTIMYWAIGKHLKTAVLKNKRAGYGEKVIATLSSELTLEFGKGWTKQQLWNCLYTVETFPTQKIISTLSGELSWSHIKELIYIKNELQRDFYTQLCIQEGWSVRQLRERVNSMLYERTAISKRPAKQIKSELKALKTKATPTPDVYFRDPYVLDFLNLHDTYSEQDLESAIIAELQRFVIELGSDFAFMARQKRIQIDGDDYYIDLLFYHRQLQRLVAIDLKLGKFKPAYKAQMELYLNWLNKHERKENEKEPIGLILCADKSNEHIELLELNKGNIRVAQYLTILPPKKLLQQKLQQAFAQAQKQHEK